jgi:hypothetical protein
MAGKGKIQQNLSRVLALTLAMLFVVFLAQVVAHSHENGRSEATCQVCQAAHLGSAPSGRALSIVTPLLAMGYVQPFVVTFFQELFFHDSPSRAPPVSTL